MVNVKKFITAKFLSAKNLGDLRGTKHNIDAVYTDVINESEKVIVRLSGVETPLVLNQTNLNILTEKYGDNSDDWINHKVTLNVVKVTFNGNLVDGIQVSPS